MRRRGTWRERPGPKGCREPRKHGPGRPGEGELSQECATRGNAGTELGNPAAVGMGMGWGRPRENRFLASESAKNPKSTGLAPRGWGTELGV